MKSGTLWPTLAAAVGTFAAPNLAFADGNHVREFSLAVAGYGEMDFAYFNYAPNQNRTGGAQRDHRLGFDTTRFTVELEGTMPAGIEFEAELELEHGGTGVSKEVEFDEFGEVEQEVERGGEANLEELHLKRSLGRFQFGIGRFYVAMGHRFDRYRPTEYLSAGRNEAETTLFGSHWAEMGVQASARWPFVTATVQLVNGLDSSGFSSKNWVASGQQGAFETVRASNLAGVARIDVTPTHEFTIGAAAYVGGSNRNRPTTDLVNDCTTVDDSTVAPCGYPAGTVTLVDMHAAWHGHGWRSQALLAFGHLTGAAAISNRNARLSNELGVDRTPVADNAAAASIEAGYDIAPLLRLCADNRLEPYARFDYYDTMVAVRSGLFDNPRFARKLFSVGLDYTYKNAIVTKLQLSQRRFGTTELRAETALNLSVGFVY